jgi:hypothetical protein
VCECIHRSTYKHCLWDVVLYFFQKKTSYMCMCFDFVTMSVINVHMISTRRGVLHFILRFIGIFEIFKLTEFHIPRCK